MKKYKLKLRALTPINIGVGEVYEPTNFVVDDGYLYEFDEYKFFEMLSDRDKRLFIQATEKTSYDSLFEIHRFIKNHKEVAKKAYIHKVQVSKSIQRDYEKKIGKVVQIEGGKKDKRKVFNKFEIAKTARVADSKKVYIPGSSLKGAISTAFEEYIFKQNIEKWKLFFNNPNPSKNLFKEVSIADSKPIKTYSAIGYALNKERFEEDTQGPSVKIEVIYSSHKQQSLFETTIDLKKFLDLDYQVSIEEIISSCNKHYLPIFKQMFKSTAFFKNCNVYEYTHRYLSAEFIKKYENLELKENQILLRVGKYSQARAVTIDGLREINVKISGGGPKRRPNKWEKLTQETTTWFFGLNERANDNLLPFGWILCEVDDG